MDSGAPVKASPSLAHCAWQAAHGWVQLSYAPGGNLLCGVALVPARPRVPVSPSPPAAIAEIVDYLRQHGHTDGQEWIWARLDWSRVTAFRRQVAHYLFTQVGPGQTITYGALAAAVNKPRAARAVGQAMRHNPFPLIVPCHRCLSANGLGGFMGNGDGARQRKLAMLAVEGISLASP